ncbi:MAG: iron chelate uptake ABC transporter family permease subunit [Cyanobacteria bacterium P01_D01_bin.6]
MGTAISLGLLVGSGILLACLMFSILLGAADINPSTVWQALFQFDGSTGHLIIRTVRLPRAILAVLVGAAFSLEFRQIYCVQGICC